MNQPSDDDAMFEALLAEVAGGPQPPDLSNQILQALRTQREAGSSTHPSTAPAPTVPAPTVPSEAITTIAIASEAAPPQGAVDPRLIAPAIVTPAERRKPGRRKTLLLSCTWIASLAASVLIAALYFQPPSQPLSQHQAPLANAESTAEPAPSPDGSPAASPPPVPHGPLPSLGIPKPGPAKPGHAKPGHQPRPTQAELAGTGAPAPFPVDSRNSVTTAEPPAIDPAVAFAAPPEPLSDEAIVARIDTLLSAAWQSAGVAPTSEADVTTRNERLRRVFGGPVDLGPSSPAAGSGSAVGSDPSEAIRRSLASESSRQLLARKFAATLLGRVGSSRLSEAQQEAFADWLSPALGGEVGFDTVAAQLLTARGSSDPEATDFNPASIWISSLAGPGSVPLVEQFGHVMLDIDLRCGRCHDHPLDGRVWQNQYWQLSAVFQSSLRWSTGQGRALRVETVPPSARGEDAVVFYELPDGRQRAVPPGTAWQWIAGSARTSDAERIARRAAELEGLAAALENNPQLARATVNRLWETIYGGPLVGSAADPSAPPESEPLLKLQAELAEQLRAHDFDVARALSWIAAAAPIRRQSPPALAPQQYELASDAELRTAGEQLRHYAAYPPEMPNRRLGELLALVQRWEGDPAALAARPDILLGQVSENGPVGENGQRRSGSGTNSQPSRGAGGGAGGRADEPVLRAMYDATAATAEVDWLSRVGTGETFDQRAMHLFYLAGYWNPSNQQLAAAASLRVGSDDDAAALGRLWWVLSQEGS